ncbi:MAG: TerB N-terminal domain-containing protein [Bacteroidales bacterium]
MKRSGTGLLFLIGLVLYIIIQIGPYILVALLIIGVISLVSYLLKRTPEQNNTDKTFKSKIKESDNTILEQFDSHKIASSKIPKKDNSIASLHFEDKQKEVKRENKKSLVINKLELEKIIHVKDVKDSNKSITYQADDCKEFPKDEVTLDILEKIIVLPDLPIKPIVRYNIEGINNIIELLQNNVVPHWDHYYVYSTSGLLDATIEQKKFYAYFKECFLNGTYLDLKDNSNYVFILLFDLIDEFKNHRNLTQVQNELEILGEKYPKTIRYTMSELSKVMISENIMSDNTSNVNLNYGKARDNKPLIQKCEWIREGQEVTIQGYKISKGNFYLGEAYLIPKQFRDKDYRQEEQPYMYASVINPNLEIIQGTNKKTIFHSYYNMSPEFRGLYLRWLAGIIDTDLLPNELISFYEFGLELRLFIDEETTISERKLILKEIIKTRDIYKERDLSIYKLNNCIDCAITKYFKDSPLEFVHEDELKTFKTFRRNYINEYMKTNNIIDCKSAYEIAREWFVEDDFEIPKKYENFGYNIFSLEFNKKFSNGIIECKTNLCSQEESYYIGKSFPEGLYYPERCYYLNCSVSKLNYNVWTIENEFQSFYYTIYRNFYPYNKAVSNNKGKETLEALFLLPPELDISDNMKLKTLITFISEKLSGEKNTIVSVNDILSMWEYSLSNVSLPKRIIDSIQNSFDTLGYGIEPDYRVHGIRFKQDEKCVIFTKTRKSPIEIDKLYLKMQAIIKMAVILAQSDGDVTTIEQENTISYVNMQIENLTKRKYLHAHYEFLKTTKQKFTGFKQYQLLFDPKSITELEVFLIKLAYADGDINNKEIETIKKIMTYFDVACEDINSKIHRIIIGEEDIPITISSEIDARDYLIPKPTKITSTFTIDKSKLSKIEDDTIKSRELLSGIFTNDEEYADNLIGHNQQTKLREILETLLSQDSWQREEVEIICNQRELMLGSVLELINDYSYTIVDDAVIDDDGETIYITTKYKEKLICQNQ